MNVENVKALAEIAKEYNLSVLEVEDGRVYLERGGRPAPSSAVEIPSSGLAPLPPVETGDEITFGTPVRAPLVGVFYASAAPGKPPFVQVGDRVSKGDTLCIIEAMKLMNEIPADHDGEIREICAQNGQVVEFGQILFRLV